MVERVTVLFLPMQGRKDYQEKLYTSFQLSDRVPKDNFYRQLSSALDLRFLYRSTASTMALKISKASILLCSSNLCWWATSKTWAATEGSSTLLLCDWIFYFSSATISISFNRRYKLNPTSSPVLLMRLQCVCFFTRLFSCSVVFESGEIGIGNRGATPSKDQK